MNYSERMENAIELAAKCWTSAIQKEPDFVISYLKFAETLLLAKPKVLGDEFRSYCLENKLYRPTSLHHNVWVSGVKALQNLGWIYPIGKVTPTQPHNHMTDVTLWKSMIFSNESPLSQRDLFGVDL